MEGEEVRRPYLRAYRVFCADQIEGLDTSFYRTRETAEDLGTEGDAALVTWFGRLGARIETSDDPRAYFHPDRDVIHMPPIATFHDTTGYYGASPPPISGAGVRARLTTNHRDNGDNQLIVEIVRESSPIKPGEWRLDLFGKSVRSSEGIVDAWVERIGSRPVSFTVHVDDGTLSIPGTADSVISVAACDTAERTRIYEYSSHGLTRNDQPKPDIAAPGTDILAAAAGQSDLAATTVKSGTSMAAPHVAGAIALAFSARAKQGRPQFNAQQIRSALTRNARDFISGHRRNWGFGKLDAEKFFKDLMEL